MAATTRDDVSGTALILHFNEELASVDYEYVALSMETAINPAGLDNTEVVSHWPGSDTIPDYLS
jgi:hypothetical protein